MKTELLIIKCGDRYIREKEGYYQACALDKASVFPLGKLDVVQDHLARITAQGMGPAEIKKLILTEKALYKTDDKTDADRA